MQSSVDYTLYKNNLITISSKEISLSCIYYPLSICLERMTVMTSDAYVLTR